MISNCIFFSIVRRFVQIRGQSMLPFEIQLQAGIYLGDVIQNGTISNLQFRERILAHDLFFWFPLA
jgi:hypothetical protein